MSEDLAPRVEELHERRLTKHIIGAYLYQLFEDNVLSRERTLVKSNNYRYRYSLLTG